MNSNKVQFAVVREDPLIEESILRGLRAKKALLIGSGGCTAFHLQNKFPDLQLTLIEPNPAQIELIEKKKSYLKKPQRDLSFFSVDNEDAHSLNNCGNFESLFRQFRFFLYEFVMPQRSWVHFFSGVGSETAQGIFAHKYWTVAFDLFFHDSILLAMFGEAAIQHAPEGSYPVYFRSVMERGLSSAKRNENYFLHHIFLGKYLPQAAPEYLSQNFVDRDWDYRNILIQEMKSFVDFDLISLSNIFDWCNESEVRDVAVKVAAEAKPGCAVVFRQLNNAKDFKKYFSGFKFVDTIDLVRGDRSLFYSRIEIGIKV